MAADLVGKFRGAVGQGHPIESIDLVPSGGGVFEVTADGKLLHSKRATGVHADPAAVCKQVAEMLERA